MKKHIIVNIILFLFVCGLVIFIVFVNRKPKEKSLVSKAEQEITQLEDKMIAMMNNMNKISFSNFVLVEEKTQSNEEQDSQSSSGSEGKQKGSSEEQNGSSQGGDSSSDFSGSSKSASSSKNENTSNTKENTQFEMKNKGTLMGQSQEVDWNDTKSDTEMLYATWPTILLDLHELNVKNEDILNFSTILDQVTLSVKQEDKTATLNNMASLYAFLPNYRSQISEDNQSINIDFVKACILNSYALVEQEKWDEMKIQLVNAMNYFSNIMNRVEGKEQKQNQISKIYVLLNELNNSIDKKEKDLYYIKYRNLMEELLNFKNEEKR